MSTLAVVEEILRETRVPMSVRQIVEYADGRLPTKSKTPDTVVARDLSMDIKKKGEDSIFIRTSPGRYTMREIYLETLAEKQADEANRDDNSPVATGAATGAREAIPYGGPDKDPDKVIDEGAANQRSDSTKTGEAEPEGGDMPMNMLSAAIRSGRVGPLAAKNSAVAQAPSDADHQEGGTRKPHMDSR